MKSRNVHRERGSLCRRLELIKTFSSSTLPNEALEQAQIWASPFSILSLTDKLRSLPDPLHQEVTTRVTWNLRTNSLKDAGGFSLESSIIQPERPSLGLTNYGEVDKGVARLCHPEVDPTPINALILLDNILNS